MEKPDSTIAARLRQERLRIGLKQGELAGVGGVSGRAQYNYESGHRSPDSNYLAAIEKLGIDTAFVLTGERKSSPPLDLSALGERISPEAIADQVLAQGDKRSQEYRAGLVDVLRFRLEGRRIECPFKAGTPQFDAYFAGNDRGHFQWRQMVDGVWKPN